MFSDIPLGEQSFSLIRTSQKIYVDKTAQIYDLTQFSRYIFLSRPRRFGKSLLVSTLEALFLGKKELFKDLWIESKWDWEASYPVLRLDFARLVAHKGTAELNKSLLRILRRYAKSYGVVVEEENAHDFIDELILELYEKTGQRAVILIDEYDRPITNNLGNLEQAEAIREWLRELYEKFKATSGETHFFFMTGITKLAKMIIFSSLGHLTDISLLARFNDIVGFTPTDVQHYFKPHLTALMEQENCSKEQLLSKLQYWYNGYSWDGKGHLYNPFCLLNVFQHGQFDHYWFETATPYFLVELIRRKYPFPHQQPPSLQDFVQVEVAKSIFNSANLVDLDLIPVLFQTGYLTVLNVEKIDTGFYQYTLGYPNYEVRWSMNSHLLSIWTQKRVSVHIQPQALMLKRALETADFKTFFQILQSFFTSIPYQLLQKYTEHTYQSLFYMLLTMLGVSIDELDLEKPNYIGRADGILTLEHLVYIIEFKFARQGKLTTLVNKAMTQILERGYHLPYMSSPKTVYQIGVAFLSKTDEEGKTILLMDYDQRQLNAG